MDKFEFGKVKPIADILTEEEAALDMYGPIPKPLEEFQKYLVDSIEKDFEQFMLSKVDD